MMGSSDKPQEGMFCAFSLREAVPQEHSLRRIGRCLDLSDLREHLAPHYSHTGRPSVDSELMIRMLLIGYCLGIRSARQLCEEVKLNLAYRWLCRMSVADQYLPRWRRGQLLTANLCLWIVFCRPGCFAESGRPGGPRQRPVAGPIPDFS